MDNLENKLVAGIKKLNGVYVTRILHEIYNPLYDGIIAKSKPTHIIMSNRIGHSCVHIPINLLFRYSLLIKCRAYSEYLPFIIQRVRYKESEYWWLCVPVLKYINMILFIKN